MLDRRWWMVVLTVACFLMTCCAVNYRCKLKYHTHQAVQTDLNGKRCWDKVKIQSCGGHCLSYEIPDWQFPYKMSYHNVCVHHERRHKFVKLRHCDPGVEPNTEDYHYVEAASCSCQVCSSEDTSCEWLPPKSTILEELLITEEKSMDDSFPEVLLDRLE